MLLYTVNRFCGQHWLCFTGLIAFVDSNGGIVSGNRCFAQHWLYCTWIIAVVDGADGVVKYNIFCGKH